MSSRVCAVVLIALIGLGCARIASSYGTLNQTYDEALHIACGMEWLSKGQYTYEFPHPPFGRIMMALGPYLKGVRSHSLDSPWDEGNAILNAGGEYWRNLTLARLGNLPFFVLACLVVYWWGSRWFSRTVGLCAVFLFSMLPPVLGHGGVATNDLACCASITLAVFCLMRWAEEPSWKRSTLLAASLALAVLCKMSALVYIPACAVTLAAVYWKNLRREPRSTVLLRLRQLVFVVAGMTILIWAGYRFSLVKLESQAKFEPLAQQVPALRKISHMPLPFTELFLGFTGLAHANKLGRESYLLGQYGTSGWWYFFPVVFGTKTPLGLLIVLLLSVALARRWIGEPPRATLRWATLLFVPVMLLVAMSAKINLGVRHILPIYPVVAIVAAQGVVWLCTRPQAKWVAVAPLVLLGFDLVHTSSAGIDQLAYFNPLAGSHPEKVLCESDLDWGQDLHRLSLRLHELGAQKVAISYFGTWPLEYAGLPPFTAIHGNEPVSGYVAVSVRNLAMGPQKDGTFVWLQGMAPNERIGKSIYLFRVPPMIAGSPENQ